MALKVSVAFRRDRDYRQSVTAAAAAEGSALVEVLIAEGATAETAILAMQQAISYMQANNAAAPAAP